MRMSIVIPAYNEEAVIGRTLRAVRRRAEGEHQLIVADGGSGDATVRIARENGADRVVESPRGRARQLNAGAGEAEENLLYFLHADTLPPRHFDRHIAGAVNRGVPAGCFRLSFRSSHPLLSLYAWFTRFDIDAFRYGDQSLFVTRELFRRAGGYREDHRLMEDNEMVRRLKSRADFAILRPRVTTSSRKYRRNGVLRLQGIFTWIWLNYHLGAPQEELVEWYGRWVR